MGELTIFTACAREGCFQKAKYAVLVCVTMKNLVRTMHWYVQYSIAVQVMYIHTAVSEIIRKKGSPTLMCSVYGKRALYLGPHVVQYVCRYTVLQNTVVFCVYLF